MNNIFDSHAHYDDEKFDLDRDETLKRVFSSGVCGVINCGSDIDSSKKSIELSKKYDKIYSAVGVHPHCAEDDSDKLDCLKDMIKEDKVVAVGEIGLDYHYDFSDREIQKIVFEKQLIFANEHNLPVIIHSREATQDTLDLLKKHKPKGVVHCFTGSVETAKEILSLGLYIGFGGAVTFKNAVKPLQSCEFVPLEKILLETDCPYMSPVPFRGKRNDSSLIEHTAKKISEIKNVDVQKVIDTATNNTLKLFSIITEV